MQKSRHTVSLIGNISKLRKQLQQQSLQCSWASSNYLPTDLRQPDLSYSRFRHSRDTFLFGQLDQSAV